MAEVNFEGDPQVRRCAHEVAKKAENQSKPRAKDDDKRVNDAMERERRKEAEKKFEGAVEKYRCQGFEKGSVKRVINKNEDKGKASLEKLLEDLQRKEGHDEKKNVVNEKPENKPVDLKRVKEFINQESDIYDLTGTIREGKKVKRQ